MRTKATRGTCSWSGCSREIVLPRNKSGLCRYHSTLKWKNANRDRWRHTNAAWRRKNPEKLSASNRASRKRVLDRLKAEAIAAYGGCCGCCGEAEPGFLTIDHVDGVVPGRHRRPNGGRMSGIQLLRRLRDEGWPSDCRVLCFNCNCGRHHNGGICPHHQPRVLVA